MTDFTRDYVQSYARSDNRDAHPDRTEYGFDRRTTTTAWTTDEPAVYCTFLACGAHGTDDRGRATSDGTVVRLYVSGDGGYGGEGACPLHRNLEDWAKVIGERRGRLGR